MPKVALIAGTYLPDRCGVAHYTARLRSELSIDTIVLTTTEAAKLANDPSVLGVVEDWNLQNLPALVQAIHQTQADLLHIQHAAGTYGFDRAIFLLPIVLRATGWHKPIITTAHEYGWWEWQPKWIPAALLESLKQWGQQQQWWDREDGFLLTQSAAIITTNDEAEKVIVDRLPDAKVHRIPIGANIDVTACKTARQKLLENCGWSEDVTAIAFFGFLHPVKGLETLLKAFQIVVQQQPQARLILIGGVESLALRGAEAKQYWNKLESTLSELQLNGRVHMTGYVPGEVASVYLSGADIGVLPFNHGVTLKSGSLLALMAHQLPVIATRSTDSTLTSLVKQIPSRNSDALIHALLELIEDPSERFRLAQQGYQFVQQLNWKTIAEAHLAIYRSVLSHA
ncbi:glycosyltransferase [Leptolyngbya sp. FACHB-17]|uniref:glycosyltransferase n=1 Tax=unclassified Leptolyngbya TaxID=2650499 RepID=UPI001680B8E4|nr:glycosyltransferase [Leptolyngbya sp. FACHB-17]MBD2079957.1 glycosyltransferase [Leptolyngbya sp. FACHB-17]